MRKLIITLICFLYLSSPASAEVAFESVASGSDSPSDGTLTINATVSSGTNLLAVACVVLRDGSGSVGDVTGITWNTSENFTLFQDGDINGTLDVETWYLVNPTATTADFVVSDPNDASVDQIAAAMIVFSDAAQSGTIIDTPGQEATSTTTNATDDVVSQAVDMLMDCIGVFIGGSSFTGGTGTTIRMEVEPGGQFTALSTTEDGGDATVTINTTWTTSKEWAKMSVNVNQFVASTIRRRSTTFLP